MYESEDPYFVDESPTRSRHRAAICPQFDESKVIQHHAAKRECDLAEIENEVKSDRIGLGPAPRSRGRLQTLESVSGASSDPSSPKDLTASLTSFEADSRKLTLPDVKDAQVRRTPQGMPVKKKTREAVVIPEMPEDLEGTLAAAATFGSSSGFRRPVLHRTATGLMREACTVMDRTGKEEQKFIDEDQKRLCDQLIEHGDGSFLRGWRCQLDPDGKLEVDFEDYIRTACRLKFSADPNNLFRSASGVEKAISLEFLAPYEFTLLDRFRVWLKDHFGRPRSFWKELDKNGKGEVLMDTFTGLVLERGFETSKEDLEEIFYCCDYLDKGYIKWEDVVFLECDPSLRASEMYKIKVSQLMHWKQLAAKEYIDYKKGLQKIKGESLQLSPKHRLAPRPWMADTFERMPAVVAQAQHQRQVDTFKREQNARDFFIDHLVKTYGNEVRAMRRGLAIDGYSFMQQTLRSYCRRHNFKLEPRDLWKALDKDKDGQISLEELCVKDALVLASFQQWCRKNILLGSCVSIIYSEQASAVSRKRTGTWYRGKKMMAPIFFETLRELECPVTKDESARNILSGALDLMDIGMISQEDLEWLDKWKPVDWVYADPNPEALSQVKAMLEDKYGHPLRAWRVLLDADDNNIVDWQEFKKACHKLKYRGDVPGAWRALDVDLSGRITMRQYDADSALLLASFKEWAEANFGSISHAFKQLDTDRSGSLTFQVLKRATLKMNWQGDIRLLFDCLDVDRVRDAKCYGKRSISLEEISFLDTWEYDIQMEAMLEEGPVNTKKKEEHAKMIAEITKRLADHTSCQRRIPYHLMPALQQKTEDSPVSSKPGSRQSSAQGVRKIRSSGTLDLDRPGTDKRKNLRRQDTKRNSCKDNPSTVFSASNELPLVASANAWAVSPMPSFPSWSELKRNASEPSLVVKPRTPARLKISHHVELRPIGESHSDELSGPSDFSISRGSKTKRADLI